jgi:hypothetical protein
MTKKDIIALLLQARNILHKQENGEEVDPMDITLAHDYIDMVIDDLIK